MSIYIDRIYIIRINIKIMIFWLGEQKINISLIK